LRKRFLARADQNHAADFFLTTGFGGFLDAHRAFIISDRRFLPAAVSPRFFTAGLVVAAFSAAFFSAQRRR
jgi:hypothetical protein